MMARRPPGAGESPDAATGFGKTDAATITEKHTAPQQLRGAPRFRHLVDHLHHLGPRPVGELLIEIAHKHEIEGDVLDLLEKFAALDPAAVARLDARNWPPLPIHRVAA